MQESNHFNYVTKQGNTHNCSNGKYKLTSTIEEQYNSNMSSTWLSGQWHVRVLWPILLHL